MTKPMTIFFLPVEDNVLILSASMPKTPWGHSDGIQPCRRSGGQRNLSDALVKLIKLQALYVM